MFNKFSVIITAGGTSSRYGNTNKLLEKIKDKTVIEETVSKFVDFENIDEIIISANNSIMDILEDMFSNPKIRIIEGGNTRQKSVYNALQAVNNEYVLIHDGARPLIRKDTIAYVLEAVVEKDAVSVMTKTTDTIKEVDAEGLLEQSIVLNYIIPKLHRDLKLLSLKKYTKSFVTETLQTIVQCLNILIFLYILLMEVTQTLRLL